MNKLTIFTLLPLLLLTSCEKPSEISKEKFLAEVESIYSTIKTEEYTKAKFIGYMKDEVNTLRSSEDSYVDCFLSSNEKDILMGREHDTFTMLVMSTLIGNQGLYQLTPNHLVNFVSKIPLEIMKFHETSNTLIMDFHRFNGNDKLLFNLTWKKDLLIQSVNISMESYEGHTEDTVRYIVSWIK